MPPSEQSRVFISYARKDGAALAQRLHQDLTDECFVVWLDVQRLTGGDVWRQEIAEAIDRADVVLALLSAGSYTSDVCRVEQQRALEKSKPIIPILVQGDCEIPDYLRDLQRLDFSNPNLYIALLPKLIASIQKQAGEPLPAVSVVRYNNAPSLPENFVNRPELLEALRNTLFTEAANRNIALTAMHGMGGIGKTVLAQALCRDKVVEQAFPDGIFWFAIGKESQLDFLARIKSVPGLDRLLGPYDGEAACLAQYRDVLRKKAALIVVDDVWRASDVQPFLAESPRSRLLITTRDTSIGAWFGAHEFTANLLTEAESRQVLANWCGRAVTDLPPQASDVIHECGHLPLALAMIGAQLRGKREFLWNSVLENLRNADLQKIKAQFPEPHTTLFRAIQISVDALDETARQRYLALAVLLEDMAVAPPVQQCLWGVDENEAAETAEQFVSLSLAQRDQPEGSISLHDLQLDYVRAQYPKEDREALNLIHGAIRLSENVIAEDPGQFTPQLVGRLLSHMESDAVKQFLGGLVCSIAKTWLRPLKPALAAPGSALMRTLRGCAAYSVAVNPDWSQALTSNVDGSISLWDLRTKQKLRTYGDQSETGLLVRTRVSGDFTQAVFNRADESSLRVCDLETRDELKPLSGHIGGILDFVVSPNGKLVVSGGRDFTLRFWDLHVGEQILSADAGWIKSLQISGDSEKLLVDAGEVVELWDLVQMRRISTFLAGSGTYGARTVMSSDATRAVSHNGHDTLTIWDLKEGQELHKCEVADDYGFNYLAIDAQGKRAISASYKEGHESGLMRIWDIEKGKELYSTPAHSNQITKVVISQSGKLAISASWDRTLRLWDLDARREVKTLLGHSGSILDFEWDEDHNRIVSASTDKTLAFWTPVTRQQTLMRTDHVNEVCGVAGAADGRTVVSGAGCRQDKMGELKVWDGATGALLRTIACHSIAMMAITADGRQAISASYDHTLQTWDLDTGICGVTLAGHRDEIHDVAVSGDGSRVFSVSRDGTARLWDARRSRELYRYVPTVERAPQCAALKEDGKQAVVGFNDGTLELLDFDAETVVSRLGRHDEFVSSVAMTVDGKRFISASYDRTLKLWDLEAKAEIQTLTDQTAYFGHVAISRNGQRAGSASERSLKLWDLDLGTLIAEFICDTEVTSCAFLDANRLVAGDAGGHVHFLRLEEPKTKG